MICNLAVTLRLPAFIAQLFKLLLQALGMSLFFLVLGMKTARVRLGFEYPSRYLGASYLELLQLCVQLSAVRDLLASFIDDRPPPCIGL